jgi:hypothetical protein
MIDIGRDRADGPMRMITELEFEIIGSLDAARPRVFAFVARLLMLRPKYGFLKNTKLHRLLPPLDN